MLRLLSIAVFSGTLACSTIRSGGFRFTGQGTEEAFQDWRSKAPSKTQAVIAALEQDETVLIHILRGHVDNRRSRGAASGRASSPSMRRQCAFHPPSGGIRRERNWDVIYDEGLRAESERTYGLPSPLDALLHHEIIGHIVPAMFDPDFTRLTEQEIENKAVAAENDYRRHVGLPLLPRSDMP